jgi:chemotaxis protein methyltransferase CheR
MDDHQFRQLLQHLGLSWSGYRKVRKGVKKRITRYMLEINCRGIAEYLEVLDNDKLVREKCERLLTVSISRFFRDKRLWEVLEKDILPGLIQKYTEKLSVWSVGCASGEEVYSLKILWDVLTPTNRHLPELSITATDVNPDYLERAKAGIYPASSLKELPEEYRSKYFEELRGDREYRLKDPLKKNITWQVKSLFDDPPETSFQIIFLRNNLLTYHMKESTIPALLNIIKCLSVDGYLIIGSHEKLPLEDHNLKPHESLPYIFKE